MNDIELPVKPEELTQTLQEIRKEIESLETPVITNNPMGFTKRLRFSYRLPYDLCVRMKFYFEHTGWRLAYHSVEDVDDHQYTVFTLCQTNDPLPGPTGAVGY